MTNTNGSGAEPSSFKDKMIQKKERFREIITAIYTGETSFTFITDKIINGGKVLLVSTRKFMDDDCLTKASSIAYTTIVSLIPALTVALTIYTTFKGVAGQKEEFFRAIATFMQEHNLKMNIDPILSAISQLIDNAGRIGGIGAAVMVFSATAMLRALEKSLNDIYRVRRHRTIFMKVIYYWAALTLGPIMLIAATTVATQLTETLSSPSYRSAAIHDGNLWVTGNKRALQYTEAGRINFTDISDQSIDYDNQRFYEVDREKRTYTRSTTRRLDSIDFRNSQLVDIQFMGSNGWVISNDGAILYTSDGGKRWSLIKYDRLRFNAIHMTSPRTGYIAGQGSLLMKTTDGGQNWNMLMADDHFSDFRNITFRNNQGIITGTRATILVTNDYGETWREVIIEEAIKNQRYLNINNAWILNNNDIIVIGDEGTILRSSDGASTWRYKNFMQKNYHTILFFDQNRGVVAGERGTMIFTDNGGKSWFQKSLPTYRVNKILYSDEILWAIGDMGMVMTSTDMGENWDGVEGRSFIAFVINFMAPFVFIWLLFLLTYMSLPNTKVPFKQASIGAAFTGAVWVIFILLFIFYAKAFAKGTFAIYGALVAIPLFLLMVYASAVIILYGAEVSYTLMHPESYRSLKKIFGRSEDLNIFNGLNILLTVYSKFEKGHGSTSIKEVLKSSAYDDEQTDHFVKIFMENNLLAQDTEGSFFPTMSSEKIKIAEAIDLIHSISYALPDWAKRSKLKNWLSEQFDNMAKNRNKILGSATLKELIERKNA